MVELSIKYLSSCAHVEKYESIELAIERVNSKFDDMQCFYKSQNGLSSKKELKLVSVPSLADTVFQVLMPPGVQYGSGKFTEKDKLLVIFRISEENEK